MGPRDGTYEFLPILIDGQMHCAEAAPANLLLDHILVYPVYSAVIIAAAVVGAGIECFFDSLAS